LFEFRNGFRLDALAYIVTSNNIRLLALDRGHGDIANCMQLIASRSAQEYGCWAP